MINFFESILDRRRNKVIKYDLFFHGRQISFFDRKVSRFQWKCILALSLFCVIGFTSIFLISLVGEFVALFLFILGSVWEIYFLYMHSGFAVGFVKPYSKILMGIWESNNLVAFDSDGNRMGQLYATVIANSSQSKTPFCIIKLKKDGSKFQDYIYDLSDKLESAIGLPLESEEDSLGYHILTFRLAPVQTVVHSSNFDRRDTSQKVYFYNNNCWDLTKAFSALISGVSGSGKSYFTYGMLTSFLNQRVYDDINKCYHNNLINIIDPKESDAFKLASQTMPADFYGSSKVDAFRIIRAFVSEMDRRKELYKQIDDFDTVLTDTGLVAPRLLVIEEFASLMSSFNKKERDDFSDLLKSVLFQGRQLGLGCLIISQKLNSEVISVSVRENLNYKFLLGSSFSNELADTVFGNHQDLPTPSDIKGSGLFAVDSDGGNVRKFIAPKFEGDLFSTILPVWKSAYEEEFSRLSTVTDEQSVGV